MSHSASPPFASSLIATESCLTAAMIQMHQSCQSSLPVCSFVTAGLTHLNCWLRSSRSLDSASALSTRTHWWRCFLPLLHVAPKHLFSPLEARAALASLSHCLPCLNSFVSSKAGNTANTISRCSSLPAATSVVSAGTAWHRKFWSESPRQLLF